MFAYVPCLQRCSPTLALLHTTVCQHLPVVLCIGRAQRGSCMGCSHVRSWVRERKWKRRE